MIYILISLTFISCGLLSYILLMGVFWRKLHIQYRLEEIGQSYEELIELDERKRLPFRNRAIDPIVENIRKIVGKITPDGMRNELEKQLIAANFPFGFGVTGWMGFKIFFSLILPCIFFVLIWFNPMNFSLKIFMFAVFTVVCILLPNVILKGRIKTRRKKIQQQLPDILDLLTISVEAGLSFDGALKRVIEKDNGELAQEFDKVLREMELGKTRGEALENLTQRCKVGDLKIFVSTIIQAEQLGVSIAKVLRIQSEQMRDKRRQRAQEEAMKAPVKMIIPLVLFIFPSIFIVILGPAVIQIKETLL